MKNGYQTHPAEGDLILHLYGEGRHRAAVQTHLASCPTCAAEYQAIASTLTLVATQPTPERSDLYGLEMWQRIRPLLPAPDPWWRLSRMRANRLVLAAASVVLIAAAFVAGRYWSPRERPVVSAANQSTDVRPDADQRARTAAIGDHLERSERVLLDLSNLEGSSVDVSSQQAWAADLIDANRLYRDAAAQAGDETVAGVLDDLERTLLDIVHAPAKLTLTELDDVRTRLEGAALLFKVRILSNELRERESAPTAPRKTT
jgi:hypothetical protein